MASIPQALKREAGRVPDREALVAGDRRLDWSGLDAAVDARAATLAAAGAGRGDRVALLAPNGAEFVLTFFGALRLGAIVVPVSTKLAAPEVDHILDDCGAALVAHAGGLPDGVSPQVPRLALGDDTGAAAGALPPVDAIGEGDDAIIMYTSGTTGRPKGVLLDHHRAVWAGLSEIASMRLADGERYLHLAPMYHSGGVVYLITLVLLGGTQVVLGDFDPAAVLDAVEREGITFFLGVPTMFGMLLSVPGVAKRDLSTWRLGVFGAAPMPARTLAAMVEAFPNVELIQLCGQTEGGPGGIYATAEQVRERPDATGRQAMVFYECRVADPETGEDTGAGGVGEILLRGDGVMKGYWNDPEATAETLRDGWLHTGDLVHLDRDGYMTVVDRLKDMIITGGQNVYSVEVERAVARHPAVADCAVVARPHDVYGESIVAVIVPEPGKHPTLEEVRSACAHHIASYKLPHDLRIAEAIPRNPSGKALKHELRALVAEAKPAPRS